jgi:uncharacterized membrane-anchored protein
MSIGANMLLILVGAILTFAVTAHPRGINLNALGMVFIVIGLISMAITLTLQKRRRSVVTQRKVYGDGTPASGQVVEERRTFDDPQAF